MYSTFLSLKSLVEIKKKGALKFEVFTNESPGLDQISSNECKHGTPTNTLFSSKDTKVFFFARKCCFLQIILAKVTRVHYLKASLKCTKISSGDTFWPFPKW